MWRGFGWWYRLIGDDVEQGLGSNDTAHTMAHEDGAHAGVDCRRRGASRDLQVDDDVLKPTSNGQQTCSQGDLATCHSRNLHTQSPRSPRVSNWGYVTALTWIVGRAWLRRARTSSGKPPKVLSSPYQLAMSTSIERRQDPTLKPWMKHKSSVRRMLASFSSTQPRQSRRRSGNQTMTKHRTSCTPAMRLSCQPPRNLRRHPTPAPNRYPPYLRCRF